MIKFLQWLFSNSGAVRGIPDARSQYVFAFGKHPLIEKTCPVCNRKYWAFMANNYYCGKFKCFKILKELGIES